MLRNVVLSLALLGALPPAGLLAFAAPSAAPTPAAVPADTYEIDAGHSTVVFAVKHLGVGKFYGRFNDMSGSFQYGSGSLDAGSVAITIASGSVDTNNKGRDRHLKNSDFFDAKQFPEIKFQGKKISGAGSDSFTLAGDITMLGVTKPIEFEVEKVGEGDDPWGNFRTGFVAKGSIKRTDFNMEYGLADGALGNEVELIVSLEGVKKK